jgi:hypothetical protein
MLSKFTFMAQITVSPDDGACAYDHSRFQNSEGLDGCSFTDDDALSQHCGGMDSRGENGWLGSEKFYESRKSERGVGHADQ